MKRALKICLAGLLCALIVAAPAAPGTAAGLYGLVKKGPTKPVCSVGKPCDAPAQVTLLFSHTTPAGPKLYSVRSKSTGAYRIGLPSGSYTVTTKERIGISRNIRPRHVHVRRGHWDKVNFFIDTGIR